MRICAFGTVRMDIHSFIDIGKIEDLSEKKIKEMSMSVGGSVYNTAAVLAAMKKDIVLYVLNIDDDFSDYINLILKKRKINIITDTRDTNSSSISLIFVDDSGQKKIISYDGIRQDKWVLKKLLNDIGQYTHFFTSFYEINTDNCSDIVKIMDKCPCNYIDLSPLIYEIDDVVIEKILNRTNILCGTESEYDMLLDAIGLSEYKSLFDKYGISYLFVKKGAEGAEVYYGGKKIMYSPKEKKKSHDTTGCGDTFNAGVISCLNYVTDEREFDDDNIAETLKLSVEMASQVAYEGFEPNMFA